MLLYRIVDVDADRARARRCVLGRQEQGSPRGRAGLEQVFEDGKVEEFFAVYECGRGAAECE